MKTEIRPQEKWTPGGDILPLLFGREMDDAPDKKELKKLELFEKGLAKEIKAGDTIEAAITKMVRMALAAEFGASLVTAKGARPMVESITRAIMHDAQLRKQALVIIGRFANE
jgi:hypothetical protein